METTHTIGITRKRVVGGGMQSKRFKVRPAYAGLVSKANARRGGKRKRSRHQNGADRGKKREER